MPAPPDLAGVTAPVVVACSGGADSLALLALAVDADLEPVAVHVDHGLRPGSAAEADRVAAAAALLGAGFLAERAVVAPGADLEARARAARYDALERARRAVGATVVLVGHTADDQAETVLVNLLRGSGVRGLAGMPPRRDAIVRPLLAWRRTETRSWCVARGLEPLDDPMNDDPAFTRVRVRREVLPLLTAVAGRDVVPVMARQAALLRDEADVLDALGRTLLAEAGDPPDARVLARAEPAVARRAVRSWLGDPPPSSAEVARVLAVARGASRAAELVTGRRVTRSGQRLHVVG